jgi:DNA-binding HxlR family transcriptional regulator
VLGDRWSLLIIRDLMFRDRRYFRELLTRSEEGIASNILADAAEAPRGGGLITQGEDPAHKQKGRYSLTEAAIQLTPILAELGGMGAQAPAGVGRSWRSGRAS